MTPDPVLHAILARDEGFGHRQHVELTWRHLENHEPEAACVLVADAIRQLAAAHGAPDKFHATITAAWVRCVAVHRERWPAPTFDEFIRRNEALLDPKLLGRHFSPTLLSGDEARTAIIEPDLRPLPALAA
jgi:hypothetical protein